MNKMISVKFHLVSQSLSRAESHQALEQWRLLTWMETETWFISLKKKTKDKRQKNDLTLAWPLSKIKDPYNRLNYPSYLSRKKQESSKDGLVWNSDGMITHQQELLQLFVGVGTTFNKLVYQVKIMNEATRRISAPSGVGSYQRNAMAENTSGFETDFFKPHYTLKPLTGPWRAQKKNK